MGAVRGVPSSIDGFVVVAVVGTFERLLPEVCSQFYIWSCGEQIASYVDFYSICMSNY